MEQKTKLRNKPTCWWSISLHDKEGKNTQGEKTVSSKNSAGKKELHENNETGLLSHIIYKKKKSKWIKDLNIRPKTPRRKHRQ